MRWNYTEYGLLWQVLTALVVVYVAKKTVLYVRLRGFKGPPGTGLTDFLHVKAMLGPSCHEWYEHVSETYGPIARVGPNILITSSPEVWTHVNIKSGYKRSDWFYRPARIDYQQDNVFTQTDNQKHDQRRKQMAPGYSGRENIELEPAIDARVRDLLNLIRSKYLSTEDIAVPLELAKKVQYFTLDVISTVGLGKSFGMLASDSDVSDYIQSSEEGLYVSNIIMALGISWIFRIPFVGKFLSPSTKDPNGFGKMMATCYQYVDERAAKPTDARSDMLASFIRHGITGDELRAEALEQIIAGSDTTAGALRGTILYLVTNPRVCGKLQQEIDNAANTWKYQLEVNDIVSYNQTKQLPYLQAVIRECIRVWPPVVNPFGRDVPAGGDTVTVEGKSMFLPGGASIVYSACAMHHDKAVYGEDAKAFRPERWFEKDQEKLAAMIRTNDLMFGHGKWQCLGKNVAQLEINKLIFELLHNFDLAPLHPQMPWNTRNSMGLFNISDMWVQVTARTLRNERNGMITTE